MKSDGFGIMCVCVYVYLCMRVLACMQSQNDSYMPTIRGRFAFSVCINVLFFFAHKSVNYSFVFRKYVLAVK